MVSLTAGGPRQFGQQRVAREAALVGNVEPAHDRHLVGSGHAPQPLGESAGDVVAVSSRRLGLRGLVFVAHDRGLSGSSAVGREISRVAERGQVELVGGHAEIEHLHLRGDLPVDDLIEHRVEVLVVVDLVGDGASLQQDRDPVALGEHREVFGLRVFRSRVQHPARLGVRGMPPCRCGCSCRPCTWDRPRGMARSAQGRTCETLSMYSRTRALLVSDASLMQTAPCPRRHQPVAAPDAQAAGNSIQSVVGAIV